jgi:hypothetical protein
MILWSFITPVILFFILVGIVYWKQDQIVQELLSSVNESFEGKIEIKDSHVAPFKSFPYISIDVTELAIYEDKEVDSEPIVYLEDCYFGFNIFNLIAGKNEIKSLKAENGYIHAIQYIDGSFNITNAFATQEEKEIEDPEEEFNMKLNDISIKNVDVYKLNKSNNIQISSYIKEAKISLEKDDDKVLTSIDTDLELNVIANQDTTWFKQKQVNGHLDIEYVKREEKLILKPSEMSIEKATFKGEGSVDIADDFNMDLNLFSEKKNFDIFLAFAPTELTTVLERYENEGNIFIEASIAGKTINGNFPTVEATFGCKNAFIDNTSNGKTLDQLNFSGYFTNRGGSDLTNMEFGLKDFSARPEAGKFAAEIFVKNFESPEIDLTLDSDFDLEFLAKFINATSFSDLKGKVEMQMKFHDIIDLSRPERSIEKLNEAYFTQLKISDLGFSTPAYHLPLTSFNTLVTVEGHKASIAYLTAKVGESDVAISGQISDLPAILHHTDDEVTAELMVLSDLLNLKELTKNKEENESAVEEEIKDFKMNLKFIGSARGFTESPNLPVGEFFITDLNADLQKYPHTLHDFHVDIFVEDSNLKIIDFSGMLDKTDFHFHGRLLDYSNVLKEEPLGKTNIAFDLNSTHIELQDLFTIDGENFVPEEYRHEELSDLALKGNAELYFNEGFKYVDVSFDELSAKMKLHPMRFENFNGRIHYEEDYLTVESLSGELGRSDLNVDLAYYLGEEGDTKNRQNRLELKSERLDFDEIFSFSIPEKMPAENTAIHSEAFNIYELPFSDMSFSMDIGYLNYRRNKLSNFLAELRTTPDHFLYVDTLETNVTGGKISLNGYFNGKNPEHIYFSPKMRLENIDLDGILFKFDNFGQEYLVSENLHGKITTDIWGRIHMHPDLIPILDDSEIHMDVTVLNGRLVNYEMLISLEEYFGGKNLHDVRFDTLQNHIDFKNGVLSIPNMTINSTLGFLQISGNQKMYGKMEMEYYVRAPLKLVAGAGWSRLFGKKEEEVDPNQVDEIEYLDENKTTAFVNIKVKGNMEDYSVSLGRDRSKKKRKKKS